MKTLYRLIAALLARIGWNEASENHLSPAHGWLLPTPKSVRERAADTPTPKR
jgi:hypothetical protein